MITLYSISCVMAFLIIVVYIGFYHKKDIWFLMTFISLFIGNSGYLALALSRTLEEALLANRIIYLGNVFLPFFLLIAIMKVCRFKFPRWMPFVLSFVNAFTLLVTMSVGYSDIYYKKAYFAILNGVGTLIKVYGALHTVYYIYLILYFSAMVAVIIRSFFKKKIVSYKHALCLAVAVFLNIGLYFFEKIADFDFELLSFSYIIGAISLLVIYRQLENYDINGILQNTLVTDSIGVMLFDSNGRFKGCNEDAASVFPELNELKLEFPVPKQKQILQATVIPILSGDTSPENSAYEYNGKIYRIAAKPFRRIGESKGKLLGTAIVVSDDTAQQEYLQLISSYNDRLEEEVAQKTRHLLVMHDNLIFSMADMVEGRDPNTGGHIKRTSAVVAIFIKKLIESGYGNLSTNFLHKVAKAAPMHDLGKIAIDDAILRKPGKFTADEYRMMQTHAEKGAEIVGRVLHREDDEEFYNIAVNVAHYHHERYDGTGYPSHLKGDNIPVEARIMALADVFDALVSNRCYKTEYSMETAVSIIEDSLGKQFDPQLGELFLCCFYELKDYYSI